MKNPTRDELVKALQAAGAAHHDYQSNVLDGVRDERWAGWYTGYVLGRVGDFVTATTLTGWLAAAPSSDDWSSAAADYVENCLRTT